MFDKTKMRQNANLGISDWTSPQLEKKTCTDYKNMSYKDFYWFTPACFKLVYYGIDSAAILNFLLFAILAYWFVHPGAAIIPGIFVLLFVVSLVRKIVNYNKIKDMNMYDMYLREW